MLFKVRYSGFACMLIVVSLNFNLPYFNWVLGSPRFIHSTCVLFNGRKRHTRFACLLLLLLLFPSVDMFPREFKKWDNTKLGTDHQSMQSGAGKYVTSQRCGVAPAPKLSGTEKLLPSHRLRLRRFVFPDWQRVGKHNASNIYCIDA